MLSVSWVGQAGWALAEEDTMLGATVVDDVTDAAPIADGDEVPLERLEAEICELAGHLAAGECRWLLLLREFDRREGWAGWGLHSCAHWLSYRCGIGLQAAARSCGSAGGWRSCRSSGRRSAPGS